MTSYPAMIRLVAIGRPMMPRPMKPTVVMSAISFVGRVSPGGPAFPGQPFEAALARPTRHVLQPHPAAVAGLLEPAEVAVQVDVAGAWFVAAGGVGDLDVPDPVGVLGDHLGQVVAVDGEVVQVGEKR